ncbi:MAG: M48 family metallopeptidase [Clostridia bacterium]
MAPEDYTIFKSDRILAKCVEGKISINTMIATYDRNVIEYVILHEFCHLKYKNHTKSFYQMLETYMPEYQQYVDEISHLQY